MNPFVGSFFVILYFTEDDYVILSFIVACDCL